MGKEINCIRSASNWVILVALLKLMGHMPALQWVRVENSLISECGGSWWKYLNMTILNVVEGGVLRTGAKVYVMNADLVYSLVC